MDQRVFDDAVTETMDLLDMTYSEALKDTISQFRQMVRFFRWEDKLLILLFFLIRTIFRISGNRSVGYTDQNRIVHGSVAIGFAPIENRFRYCSVGRRAERTDCT